MNKISVTDDFIEISIEGLDKLWSFKGKVTIPRDAIVKAYLRTEDVKPPAMRAPGTYIPKLIAAGTYYGTDKREFWNTNFGDNCIVFELTGFEYSRVVVDVPNAKKLIKSL